MAETLINTNQNQLNTQNGSYVELIKNTQDGKVGLTTALVNKGVDVSSSSTFEELVSATNNLETMTGKFTPVIGNSIALTTYSFNVRKSFSDIRCNRFYRFNEKGLFRFILYSNSIIYIENLTGDYYDSSTAGPSRYTFTLPVLASKFTAGYYLSSCAANFYVNESGTKLWYIENASVTGTHIYEYIIDYSQVNSDSPTNLTVTLNKTFTLSSAITGNGTGVCIVNEDKKKMLVYIGDEGSYTSYNTNILPFLYIIDYSEGYDNLITIPVTSNISVVGYKCCPRGFNKNIFNGNYNSNAYQSYRVDWDTNSIIYQNPSIQNNCILIDLTINNVSKIISPYNEIFYEDGIQKNRLHLVDIENGSDQTFTVDNYEAELDYSGTSAYIRYTTYNVLSIPQLDTTNNQLYLSGGLPGSYFKLNTINNQLDIEYIPACTITSNVGVCSCIISFKNKRIFFIDTSENNTTFNFLYNGELYMNKIIAFVYINNNGGKAAFIDWYIDKLKGNVLDAPKTALLVEDN